MMESGEYTWNPTRKKFIAINLLAKKNKKRRTKAKIANKSRRINRKKK